MRGIGAQNGLDFLFKKVIPEKEKMKFCKKCHQRVIKMVSDVEEIKKQMYVH